MSQAACEFGLVDDVKPNQGGRYLGPIEAILDVIREETLDFRERLHKATP